MFEELIPWKYHVHMFFIEKAFRYDHKQIKNKIHLSPYTTPILQELQLYCSHSLNESYGIEKYIAYIILMSYEELKRISFG